MKRTECVMTRKALLSLVVAAIAVIGVGAYAAGKGGDATGNVVVESAVKAAEEAVKADSPEAKSVAAAASTAPGSTDVESAMAPRVMGNPDAPVRIEEFASLSCSHCADFYKNTFPKLKENYLDTGKVFFVYTDFPLNPSALDASMAARCLPPAHYFNFIKMLFENQSQWAFHENYRQLLQFNTAMLGMSTDAFNACLGNEDLRKALATKMSEASEKHKVRSTPTFVLDDTEVLGGAKTYEEFAAALDKRLAAKGK